MAQEYTPSPKIGHYDTRGKYLKVYDMLAPTFDRSKIHLEIYQYDPKPNVSASHYINEADAQRLAYLIKSGRLGEGAASFTDYKGSKRDKYSTGFESRVLRIEKQPAKSGNGFVYVVKIENGPGTASATGAVMPAKGAADPMTTLMFPMMETQALNLACQLETYITAYHAAQYATIYAGRVEAEQRDRQA